MPFIPILRSSGRGFFHGPAIRLHHSPLADQRHRLTFVISRPLVEALRWEQEDRIVIALGVGSDAGSFQFTRVSRRDAGLKLEPRTTNGFRVAVSLPARVHDIDIATLCAGRPRPDVLDHQVSGEMLLARLSPVSTAAPTRADADLRGVVPIGQRS